ncbi:hypothetical protein [Microbacterium sp. T2.11-28]|uniref:hypothetical protein n=1 Tax=Microbacterium sp. T2.11-28 TaxID=3041169 RepID=UPI00247779B2|nr:hypothetical protein [Microbacterium sp. T2.11-28]CAI9393784.1 hypothetical protein MICABA_02566 [Microbacterium sp. T2.11-28]
MSTPPARVRSRLTAVAGHWWEAVSSGRFFTRWTLLASGVAAVLILSPYGGLDGVTEHLAAMAASLLAWLVIVVLVLPVAVAERRLDSALARGVLVIGTLIAVSIARPFLNDLTASTLFGHEGTGEWLQRIATNALSWFAVLPLVAASAAWYADAKESANRLAAALAVFDDLRGRVIRYGQQNAALLTDAVADVRRRRDALLAGTIDFDAVRAFADEVRAASHRLDDRLRSRLDGVVDGGAAETARGPAVPFLARLARPNPLLVVVLYYLASTPYTFVLGGIPLILVALALLLLLAYAADLVIRVAGRGHGPVLRGAIVLASWVGVGVGIVLIGFLLTSADGIVLAIPLVTVPALAVVVGLTADAVERSREQSRTLTELLAHTDALATAQTAQAREPLWRAVDLLHDRVQSRCVIFAARVDDRPPTAEEIRRFRIDTESAFAEILVGAPERSDTTDLDGLLAIWSGILDVRADIDAAAVVALQDAEVAAAVGAVVSEGFVNAVKHSAARAARLSVSTSADESELRVAVSSSGTLRGTGTPGLGLASFGERAHLRQVGDQVVLEVIVPLSHHEATTFDTSHRRRRPPTMAVRVP